MMDVVIKILVGVVFVYTWDYMAPYLTRSDSTAEKFLERAVVRFLSWTEIYLTKVMTTFRQQFYQDLPDLGNAVGIHVPKSESRPDVTSAGSKSQPVHVPIRQTSSYQPSHRGVDELVALSRLEECTNGSHYRRPVAACYESQAATPAAYTQNNHSRLLSKRERSKTCPRELQRLEKLANSRKQLELAASKTDKLFHQVWENLDQLLPPRQREDKSRGELRQKMFMFETDFRQEGTRLESVLQRIKGQQFDNKESLALEQEKFANDLDYYNNTLEKFRKWLRHVYSENKSHHENWRKKPLREKLLNKPRQEPFQDESFQEDLQKKPLHEVVEMKIQEVSQNQRRRVDLRKKILHENLRKELQFLEYFQNKLHQEPLKNKLPQEDQKNVGQHGQERQKTREAGKCGQEPGQPKSALKRTNTRIYPVGRVENGDARMADMERNTKATTEAEMKRRKIYRELPMKGA